MHDALGVRGRQAVGDLDRELRRLPVRERSGLQALAQGLALEQLGDRVGGPVGFAEIEDRQDVRV
jgi:hypothetical protein